MEQYDRLYRLYDDHDTATLRAYQDFVDVFPPVDSRVALEYWQDASEELDARKESIREAFPEVGGTFAELAARATRDQAFTALDLLTKYGRGVNVLVLDVDETLRSAGNTDNEIPRETLHAMTECHEAGIPIVICTGQTLENVKGFLIQGLGNEVVHSGEVGVVYETGTGVFTPGHGADTKRLLYEDLDPDVRAVFDRVRSRVLSEAPEAIRSGCHLQGNEFNVTLKPNFETGSDRAHDVIDRALCYELDLLGEAVAHRIAAGGDDERIATGDGDGIAGGDGADADPGRTDADAREGADAGATDPDRVADWARAHYAAADPEIRAVLEERGGMPGADPEGIPGTVAAFFERIDVAYYEADAAEIGSLDLDKVAGVEAAFEVLGIDDPFALVMGDSKSDLRVMRWVAENDMGIAAAPDHASGDVLDHVMGTDELVFDAGRATEPLRTVYALDRLAGVVE